MVLLFSCKTDEKALPASLNDAALLLVFNDILKINGFEDGLITSNKAGQEVVVSKILNDTINFAQVIRLSSNLQKTLSRTDSLYIVQQLNEKKKLNIGRPFTVKAIFTADPDYLEKIQNQIKGKHNGLGYYIISKPFLTIAKDKAIIIEEYNCPYCGWGIALILQKKNNYWVIVEQLSLWDS